jgi:hypothetical protein
LRKQEKTMTAAAFTASGWRPMVSGSMQGFVTLRLPSGLQINDCTLHQKGDRRWIGLPGKPQIDSDGKVRTGDGGKKLYTPVNEIPDRAARDKFNELALAAVDRLLGT